MTDKTATFPIDMNYWIILRTLGKKIIIRAGNIEIKKQRVTDTDGHEVCQAEAEGGVKIRPKSYDITNFPTK